MMPKLLRVSERIAVRVDGDADGREAAGLDAASAVATVRALLRGPHVEVDGAQLGRALLEDHADLVLAGGPARNRDGDLHGRGVRPGRDHWHVGAGQLAVDVRGDGQAGRGLAT